ncbi:amino acid dehydrogenase [Phenylobacterium sp. Root77]|uniref:D-amino acid dehydrogenase n=1 Tax=unclassified Phenylobacterium TaxID=2640670 RepID=UPI0006F846FA|nr:MULTISPECIES: D-amino acid dehydrogenase [unclassified Phenylobacterium]KQW71847.1 amino acid dehydrogenase [Phenylobacterium sp. Root1277]KQW94767.1 amino acid dehydrogenase [Phenylobacterium sp. Root1290]KRC44460.1 amino acid dehydrogenase [Phenylobacterium sp. Root77]
MKVAVLGGGVIGVSSAYYLAKAGHEVTVIERQAGPALETSFANAGEISPGYASPWAGPGIPAKAVKWLLMEHAPLILKPKFDVATIGWLLSTLRNCTEGRYAINKSRMVRLAEYSRDLLIALRAETGVAYDERSRGTLQLFRTQAQMDGIGKDVEVLKSYGVPYEVLDAAGCVGAEPGLANALEPIVGGLRLPNDETGDCFKFTNALADIAKGMGVDFQFDTAIEGLRKEGGAVAAVRTSRGEVTADAFLVAMGSYSPALVASFGMRLPVYPVKGYSITAPILDAERAPVSTLLDESYKVAITRLGDRIRVGGMAEISGFNNDLHPRRRRTLEHSMQSLFPGAGDAAAASFWSGLRPMTPDGTPVVGATPIGKLFLNTGHGTLGWTMACGSGQVIADVISGAASAIDTRDLAISRYSN